MLLFLDVLVYFSLTLWYNIYVERSMTCILKKRREPPRSALFYKQSKYLFSQISIA